MLLSCESNEDTFALEVDNLDQLEEVFIEVRSQDDLNIKVDPEKLWWRFFEIEKDYNAHGDNNFKKDFGTLDLSRVFLFSKPKMDKADGGSISSRGSTVINMFAIPIVDAGGTISSVAIAEDSGDQTRYTIYSGSVDLTDEFNQVSTDTENYVASFEAFCEYWTLPTDISGNNSGCTGGIDDSSTLEAGGSLGFLCKGDYCPNGWGTKSPPCGHTRIPCNIDPVGTAGTGTSSGTTVLVYIISGSSQSLFLGNIVISNNTSGGGGGGGGGSYTLVFSRDDLMNAIDDFNSRNGTDLTYNQLTSEENLGCLYFASQNYDNNNQDTDGLEYCMERALRISRIMECTDAEDIDLIIIIIGSDCDQANDFCECMDNALIDNLEDEPGYDDLNDCEKVLVHQYPLKAITILRNTILATNVMNDNFPIYEDDDCPGAFLHAYFSAINARSVGTSLARQFGDAHECLVNPDRINANIMDLHNNDIGFSYSNSQNIESDICNALEAGHMLVYENPYEDNSVLISSSLHSCQCN